MDGMKKLLGALIVLAAGVVWTTHAHAAAPIADEGQAFVRTLVPAAALATKATDA